MTPKKRFNIFHRDGFTCQYCGKKPPEVILEVDHIIPVSKGGNDDEDNLITSCFECNRGKTNKKLEDVPERIEHNLEEIKERKKQLKEYYNYKEEVERRNYAIMSELCDYWSELWDYQCGLNVRGEAGVRRFLKDFDKLEIKDAMAKARYKVNSNSEDSLKYFYGIMWTKLRNRNMKNGVDWRY